MNVGKTALWRTKNKPGNMLLLVGIFTIISTFLFILFGFWNNVDEKQAYYQDTIPGRLVIRSGNQSYAKPKEGYALDEDVINSLMKKTDGTIDNKVAIAFAFPDSFHVKEENEVGKKLQIANGVYSAKDIIPSITVMGVLDSTKYPWFWSGKYKMISGNHISPADDTKYVAIISQGLAQSNHLQIGSKIHIRIEGNEELTELTIQGVFSAIEAQENASRSNPENRIIIPVGCLKKLTGTNQLSEVDIYLNRAYEATKFQKMLADSGQQSIRSAKIITDNYEYVKKSSVLQGLRQYIFITTITLFISALSIIGLYIIYQNMTRKREFMIYLSRGAFCSAISVQVMLEIGISFIAGNLIALIICILLCHGAMSILVFQDIRIQSLSDMLNRRNVFMILGIETLTIFIANSVTFFNLLLKQKHGKTYS